jgi:hypothetical protein
MLDGMRFQLSTTPELFTTMVPLTTTTIGDVRRWHHSASRMVFGLFSLLFIFPALVWGESPSPLTPVEPPQGGTLFQKALGQLALKENAGEIADQLLQRIREDGHEMRFGEPEVRASIQDPNRIDLVFPVSLKASDLIREQLEQAARSLGGVVRPASYERRRGKIVQISSDPEILEYFHRRVAGLVFMAELVITDGSVYLCYDEDEARNSLRNPIVPVQLMWSTPKEQRVVGLGVNPSLAKARPPSSGRTTERDPGSIAVFDEPITFYVAFTIPLELAKRIKNIEGTFLQWELTELDAYSVDRTDLAMRAPCHLTAAER